MGLRLKNYFRTFPHSNSLRKECARYEADLEEMQEEGISSDSIPTLRNGKHGTPDLYDDVPRHEATKSWETKPKGTRHRERDTIRTKEDPDAVQVEALDEERM